MPGSLARPDGVPAPCQSGSGASGRWGAVVRVLVFVFVLAGVAPAAARAQQQPSAPTALVFEGVTVIDVEHGARVRDQRVVVVGNRIQALGRRRTVQLPPGARVVDARGKYLIPGLWDMHFHQYRNAAWVYRQLIANGVTGIRDAGTAVPLDTLGLWKREIAAGLRIGPRQVVSGQATDENKRCQRANRSFHTCVSGPEDARHYVDSLHAAGADMIKTYTLSDSTYFALAAEARRVGIPFGGHVHQEPMGAPRSAIDGVVASDSGARILDHHTYMDECDNEGQDLSVERCAAVAARLRRNDTWVADFWPYLRGKALPDSVRAALQWRALSYAGPGQEQDTAWRPLSAAERRRLAPGKIWAASLGVDSTTAGPPEGCQLVAARYAANVPLLANTDAFQTIGAGVHAYLGLKTLCGVPPLWALQTATLNPARALHATDSLGTVAVGKVADLVLLEGDPLEDIWNVSQIRAVVANGRYFDRAALDQLLIEATAEYQTILDRKRAADQAKANKKDAPAP